MAKNSTARIRANARYNAKAYDDMKIHVKKGERDRLKLYCVQNGVSLNGFVTSAVAYCIQNGVDLSGVPALADVLPVSDGFPPD